VLLAVLSPFRILALALWIISLPVMAGLFAAAVYRVGVFIRSRLIHSRLGEEKEFVKESSKMQLVLLLIIVLTFLDVLFSLLILGCRCRLGLRGTFYCLYFTLNPPRICL
jgi:hypothetical protein